MRLPTLLSLTLTTSAATASFIERDLFQEGDGLITYDSESGLEWLDASALPSLTWTDVLQGVDGWKTLGFRIADSTEIWQLLLNSSATHLVWAPSYAGGADQETQDAHSLLSSYGLTSSFVVPEFTNHTQGTMNTSVSNAEIASFADLYADYEAGDSISWDDSYFIRYYEPSSTGGSYIYAHDQGVVDSCNIVGALTPNGCPPFNTALVRSAPAVPLPSATWLLASGLISVFGLKFSGFRK